MKKILLTTFFITAFGFLSSAQTVVWSYDFNDLTVGDAFNKNTDPVIGAKYTIASQVYDKVIEKSSGDYAIEYKVLAESHSRFKLNNFQDWATNNLTPGNTYKFEVDIKIDTNQVASEIVTLAILAVYDDRTKHNTRPKFDYDPANGEWQTISAEWTFPTDLSLTDFDFELKANQDGSYTISTDNWKLIDLGDNATRISKTTSYNLTVGPNPSYGLFRLNSEKPVAGYTVFNATGQVVKQVNSLSDLSTNVDISGSPKGMYLIKVKYENGESEIIRTVVK
jgi:hypothetical protein